MGRHFLARTAALFLLVSLFILGCGANKTGGAVPETDTSTDLLGGGSTGGTGTDALPGLGGDPSTITGENSTPALPGGDAASGGINSPAGSDINQVGSQFASAYQNLFSGLGSFDPRQTPQQAQSVFNNFMCAMQRANLFRTVASQVTLPEYVQSLYINVLGRPAESSEVISFHANNIIQNGNRAGVRGFLLSDEFMNKVVTKAYKYFFGAKRNPSAAEVKGWVDYIKQHQDNPGGSVTLERMYASFLGSAEFYSKNAASNQRSYVIRMYQYALNRVPSEAEINIWRANRNYTVQSVRVEAANGFFTSREYRLKKIGQLIRKFWAIPVTGSDLAELLNGMENGRDQLITMTDMLTHPKYYARIHAVWYQFAQFAQSGQCSNQ